MASSEPEGSTPFTKPDHPDMEALAEVTREFLTPREGVDMDESLRVSLGLLADPQSASYVAIQRALGFLQITSPDELTVRQQEVFSLSVFWLDGFIAGGHLERGRTEGLSDGDEMKKILTWTQPVCENRWREMSPGREPVRIVAPVEEWDPCCYCGTLTNIYVRLDPTTVPFPRVEEP